MPLEMPVAQVKLPTTFDQVLGSCPLVLIGLTQMKKEQPISAAAFSGRFAVHHSRRPSLSTAHRSRRLPRETRPFCRCKALSRRRARAKSSRLPLAPELLSRQGPQQLTSKAARQVVLGRCLWFFAGLEAL